LTAEREMVVRERDHLLAAMGDRQAPSGG